MPIRRDVFGDRRFWANVYAGAFGQIGDRPEPENVCEQLGVSDREALAWWHEFTGWYPGIFDESDGYSEDPATVPIELVNDIELRVEFHPGDKYWFLQGSHDLKATLANVGPHWALPGLRWQEAAEIIAAAPAQDWAVKLLLLPVVWLTEGDDTHAARRVAEIAWSASALVSARSAKLLADIWVKAIEGGRGYRWWQSQGGWVCNARWSTRSQDSPIADVDLINRLVSAAAGGESATS